MNGIRKTKQLSKFKFLKLRHRNFTGSVLHEEISISINKNDYLFCWLWNGVGAIILGGVSLAEDYPHLFNVVISGNSILSGGGCKIEGSIIVLLMNLIFMVGFIMANKKKGKIYKS